MAEGWRNINAVQVRAEKVRSERCSETWVLVDRRKSGSRYALLPHSFTYSPCLKSQRIVVMPSPPDAADLFEQLRIIRFVADEVCLRGIDDQQWRRIVFVKETRVSFL